jgi:hypothetical protein
MSANADAFLARWHAIVAAKDREGLRAVLAEDVTVGAPPYWKKLEGRNVVYRLLGVIVRTIEDFTYHREWIAGDELALEFRGRVGDRELQGIDLITLDGAGRVRNLDVMIRPLNALLALRDAVAAQMAALARP